MDDVKMNVKTLASYMNMTIEELANACDIDVNHLRSVQAGRAAMTARDLVMLQRITKIPYENIKID